ncbi:TRAP transporter large permease [Marinivivus vitaminiproducens]|uniref:TRAP transporter large permease n=1 Tax=Marinivivus vitaminiproducens TaxID=3035935 RepID=UPI0027A07BF9|nr:TRAP transporter large permease [Geminicoccaceae bacterium SCSIO 64248]
MSPVSLLFVSFFAMIVLRVPVAYALTLASLIIILQEGLRPDLVVQQMFQGLNSFTLLAVPFFLLAGQLLNNGMITDRLMRVAQVMVGWVRGGLGHVNVTVSMIFAGMSGSSTADTAGVGSVIIPAMVARGYSRTFTVALTAASSTMGSIIPPSIIMVIYGAQGGVSIGALFLAGAIPGMLVGVLQLAYSYYYARLNDLPAEPRATRGEFATAWKEGFLPLLVPVIIIGGVLTGKFTATEAGMVAVVYVMVLMFVLYRSAKLRALPTILSEAAVLYSQPLLAVAAATVFGWLLAFYQAPDMIADIASGMTGSVPLTLIGIMFVFIVVGTFMDAIPAIIIFMPIVTKLVETSGANPIHAGLIVVMTLALGLATPPYGLCLLLAAAIGKVPVVRVMPQMLVFYALFLAVVLLIIFVPGIALFLPRLIMPQFVG